MRGGIAALGVVAFLAGCGGGPYSQQEREVRSQVAQYFNSLNGEAALLSIDAKATRSVADAPSLGRTVNTYEWRPDGYIVPDMTCPEARCKAKLGTVAWLGIDLKCPVCGAALADEINRLGRSLPMFEIKSGQTLPIVVLVRYVRRVGVYDPTATVSVSSRTQETIPVDAFAARDRRDPKNYYAGGFHRPDAAFIGATGFVFKGGTLRQIDPGSVRKMTAMPPENVPVSAMKLGPTVAVEELMRTWAAIAPAAAPAAPKAE
jgi:hypothetical protein